MNAAEIQPNLTFGEWLQDQLFTHGLTQERFAEEIGAGQSTVSAWVNGRPPGRRSCYRIAAFFGVPRQTVLRYAGREVHPGEIDPEPDIDISDRDIPRELANLWAEGSQWLGPDDWEFVRSVVRHIAQTKQSGR